MASKKDAKKAKIADKAKDTAKPAVSTAKKAPSPPPKKNASTSKAKVKPPSPAKPAVSTGKGKKDTKATTPVSPPKAPTPAKGKRGPPSPSPAKNDASLGKPVKKTKSDEQIVKVITKGGAAVDGLVPNKQNYRVLQDGGKTYSATLNQSNLDHNNNKFYMIQILVNQKTGAIHYWNRWGRVGVDGQNCLKGPMAKETAIRQYNAKHHDKTVKGDYREIQIKYDADDEKDEKKDKPKDEKKGPKKDVASKIDKGLQKLIQLIFDVNVMNNTMKQIGYDAKKMPLGKLGDSTIKEAYGVLTQLSNAIKNGDRQAQKKLSSQFYTLIPHDFGFKAMINFILDTDEKVKEKVKMLETISDMKITTKLLDQKSDDDLNVIDQNYKKLGCNIKTIDEKTPQYKVIEEYFNNTKGYYGKVTIGEVYEIFRPTEQKNYDQKIGNNMLLWHGSRVSNFVGILSQGLRIAPPEAPVSGYLFGKGIYLADMAQKSINYCRSYGSDSALMLLVEGAIGNPNILLGSDSNAKALCEKAKKDSTKCHGSKAPPQESYVKLKNITVPKGVPKPTSSGSYMGHNEYIVYNMSQARIRYVIRMDMKGQ